MMHEVSVIIMAGGLGKRMNSDLPKVLHKINNEPMIVRIIKTVIGIDPKRIFIVVGKYKDIISKTIDESNIDYEGDIEYIEQHTPQGTGHAIQCCRNKLLNIKYDKNRDGDTIDNILILSGDVPLISKNTIVEMLNKMINEKSNVSIIGCLLDNPHGYGRIIEKNNNFYKIIEEKDCTEEERLVKNINAGIYIINQIYLCKYLQYITNNNSQKEYYLTDIIEIIKKHELEKITIYTITQDKQYEIMCVNTQNQLQELECFINSKNLN